MNLNVIAPLDFDWYQATITDVLDPEEVIHDLLIGSGPFTFSESNGGYNRPASARGTSPTGGTMGVYWGSNLPVHVLATGPTAPHVAHVLRSRYPAHTVSRADVAFDFDQPDGFDLAWRSVAMLAHTTRRAGNGGRIKTQTAGDWIDAEDGRTLYAGAPTSAVRIRVYEKGYEQRAKHPDRDFSLDWVRCEWQIRPRSRDKGRASTATLAELASWTAFAADVHSAMLGVALEPYRHPVEDKTPSEYWMAYQYGVVLREWATLTPSEIVERLHAALASAQRRPQPERTPRPAHDASAQFFR